jgi:peptide/nickel transport system permease protein
MVGFIIRRLLIAIPNLLLISMVTFMIIQLPPGDYLTTYAAGLAASGETIDQQTLQALRQRYGLDQPVYIQYLKWMNGVVHGDFGQSFQWSEPVADLIGERLALTIVLSFATLILTWLIAFPIGIYSAVKQYSIGDYIATFFGFVGIAVPSFMIALVLMYVSFKFFNQSVGGLFSPEYENAPWDMAKVGDLIQHLWIPILILGLGGTAELIRIMRANLLDELHKPYVITARAKGLPEWKVLLKYPVRVALNPFISTAGWLLPGLVSGSVIVAVVLNLPVTGPLFLNALTSKDMYLAGSFILLLSVLTIIGTLISDIVLAWLDPRIRYQQ